MRLLPSVASRSAVLNARTGHVRTSPHLSVNECGLNARALTHSPAFLSFLFLSTEMITSTLPITSTTLVKISTPASTTTTHAGLAPAPLPQARPCATSVRFLMRETFSGISGISFTLSHKNTHGIVLTKLQSSSPSSAIKRFHILNKPWEARWRVLFSHSCATWNITFPPGSSSGGWRICSTSQCSFSLLASRVLLKLTHGESAATHLELLRASRPSRVRSGISHRWWLKDHAGVGSPLFLLLIQFFLLLHFSLFTVTLELW